MFRILSAVLVFMVATPMALADGLIPDRRMTLLHDVDFYGSDLTNIFDTNFDACARACLTDTNCKAFTFNTKSSACFPKSDITQSQPFEGALSVKVTDASQAELQRAQAQRAQARFLTTRDISAAYEQAAGMTKRYAANDFTAQQYVEAARQARGEGKPSVAMRFIGAGLTVEDRSDLWEQYARDAAASAEQIKDKQRDYNRRYLSAAINAYLRASSPAMSVNALTLMANAFERNGRGRDAIAPLRLAQSLQPRSDTEDALDRVVRLFGFNVAETDVESNSVEPRICVAFSEDLSKTTDYAPFVQSRIEGVSVEAQDRKLCLGGLNHGERYRFTLRQGLPAASGEVLQKPIEITQYVRDRAPSVRFPGRAYILPSTGDAALPVVAVNTDTLDLTLFKVSDRNILRTMQNDFFAKPLSYYGEREFRDSMGVEVWKGKGDVQTELNQDVTTRLPVSEIIGPMVPGVYALKAAVSGPSDEDSAATQWFVISDLGLTSLEGVDGLHVFVRGLSDVAAKEDVTVSLISRANEVLDTIQTDAEGYARFDPGLIQGTGGAAPGLLTVQKGDDFAFLSLRDPEFDLSDRGVEGRAPAKPLDLFVTTERGAYRAGETIHALALARDGAAQAVEDLPLTAILTRPDGVEYSRVSEQDAGAGGRIFDMPLGTEVPRGTWTLAVFADPDAPALSTQNLLVEDFLPERIDATLTMPNGPIVVGGQAPELDIEARYLFGAPGADLAVEGDVTLRAATSLDGFKGYVFGRHDTPFRPLRSGFVSSVRTDATGKATAELDIPELSEVMQPLEAEVTVRVREGSNRPIERRISRPLLLDKPLIGVKPAFDGVLSENSEAEFSVVALAPDLTPQDMQVRWTINRVRTEYQWYSNYGNWYWDPVTSRSRVASGETTIKAGEPLQISAPVEWGEYEVKVERTDGPYVATSMSFNAGWYASADAAQTPDLLELSLDKPRYASGDTASLRIVSRYAGTALVTVMSNRLIDMKAVEVTEGENLVTLPVTDEWGSGAYVAASVLRPMDVASGQNPARALGLSHAAIDPEDAKLEATFVNDTEAAPRGPLTARLKVDNADGETYAMIAAVDQGILNLTGFTPPDASGYYFGQRKLGVAIRDVYGRLIDATSGAVGAVRSGGDASAQLRAKSPPPTEELVAYVSGPLKVGDNGEVETVFDLPAFNGSVRLMAVVWSKDGVGEADAEVLVRDPVVVTATLPRFLAPGDSSQLLLEIVHADGPTGEMPLSVEASGARLTGEVPSTVTIGAQETERLSVPFEVAGSDNATITVALTTPDGRELTQTHGIDIRRSDPLIQRRSQFDLAAGGTFTLDGNAFAGFAPGSASVTLAAGPLARFDVPGLLNALDKYPYGCTEQVTSKAMPLLYLDQVARAMGLEDRDGIAERISESVSLVLTNQASNGAFGLWQPDRGDLWLSAYVTDFLSRARGLGHDVPQVAFRQALNNLRNEVNSAPDFENGGEGLAYALLVLAREGAASIGDLRYYADTKAQDFGTALAVAQLGAGLAAYGDPSRADAMFRRAATLLDRENGNDQLWRDDYGTDLRDAAAVLTLAVESGSNALDIGRISARIAPSIGDVVGRSTQESVWSLLAANALIDRRGTGLSLNGEPVDGPLVKVLEEAAQQPVQITSAEQTTVTLTAIGVSHEPVQAGGNGYRIGRAYYDLDGNPVDASVIASGTRLVSVLTVTPLAKGEARLIVNDPLPAGFEIDNPNLLRSGDVKQLPWLDTDANVRNTEFRDDRFIAAVDHFGTKEFQLAYILRAVAPGDYHHPAASVEDMYRPFYRARTDEGRVQVTGR
ncbi:alpha-2-macroglobulin family protein [Litoreibacter arenae]|uniref:PAN domain protein n=1 Tax=Litoreibacter arenae DSM 19593 TaxID=1123360 RepID=S9QDQ2_9RHOB|nr:alpha-2-macroglobulin family protein [Litoreibacter arenae]EPX77708.1 PAN domain protein [Litoreibacter arenae DSM 19593]